MTSLLPDLRFALRTLARQPLFATVAILSLALGIGANTAIFTVMDQLMLRRLPIRDPQRIVMIYQHANNMGSNLGTRMNSYPMYQDFQRKAAPFSDVICRRLVEASLAVGNVTERVGAEIVSGNYFQALGVKPALGRVFNSAEDDQVYAGHPVVVLSYDYWKTRFAANPHVVGMKIQVNNYPMTIVGVSAEGFQGLDPAQEPQIRVPILMKDAMLPDFTWVHMADRRCRWVQVFARLKPGYTPESAQAALQVLFTQIRQYEMTLPAAKDWSQYSRNDFMRGAIRVETASTGYSDLRQGFSKALIVLMCMVGLVLLIACANVANLLIARAVARQKEIAVRLSIGASRGRLIQQLLVESMLLSLAGGIAGIGVAVALTRGLLSLATTTDAHLLLHATPDLRVLLFTLALTFLTGLIFGLVPALRASRPDLWTTLKDAVGAIAGSGSSLVLRKSLVVVQVALSFLLLFGAGLFVRSLQNLESTKTGFRDLDNVVTFQISPSLNGYPSPRAAHLDSELLDEIRAIPGVKSAAYAAVPVLSGDEWDSSKMVEGHRTKEGEDMQAFMNAVSPGYFATMGTPLLEGRDFTNADMHDGSHVVIVNQSFERHFFGNQSAIGRHIGDDNGPKTKLDSEIIGVVADSLYEGPREGVHRQAFEPFWGNNSLVFYVRAGIGSDALFGALRHAVKRMDSALPVYALKTVENQLDQTLLSDRLVALLSAGFGLLATLLAAIGLYGVLAFVVNRRTKELGLRMALGANPGSVIWIVMKDVLLLLVIGLAVAAPAAVGLGRIVSNQLYQIQAADPAIAIAAMLLLAAVAGAAGFIPAWRASRIDPILALRYE